MADQIFAVNSGFYDAVNSDRTYSADDMNRPYKRVISNGVFATPKGTKSTDLQVVSANSGMQIIVQKGEGIFADKWFENPAAINITVPANTGTVPRIDSVLVQVDKRTSGRVGNIVYRTGTPSLNPAAPAINTVSNVTEYRLANIRVNAGVTAITSSMITDRRGSSDCPWITSLIYQVDTSVLYDQWAAAYEEYFEAEKEMWDDWYGYLTEELNVSLTLVKKTNTFVTINETDTIDIGIPEYNANTDMLEVYINGLRAIEGNQYTVNGNTSITLSAPLSTGQTVDFIVLKSVVMGNTDDIISLIDALEDRIATIQGGNPTVVSSASEMTDTNKIYILSTDSKWYYYNLSSSAWVAGGVYGGVPTDKTLTQSDMAADAKVTGDKITTIKNNFEKTFVANAQVLSVKLGEFIRQSDGKNVKQSGAKTYARSALFYTMRAPAAVRLENDDYKFCVFFYDETGNISTGAGYLYNSGYMVNQFCYMDATANKFGVVYTRNDGAELTEQDAEIILSSLRCYGYTDDSLSLDGVAADAKSTGDKIAEISDIVTEISDEMAEKETYTFLHTPPQSEGAYNAIRRARQLADLKWTPAENDKIRREYYIPASTYEETREHGFRDDSMFFENECVGAPYSSKNNQRIGTDIGLETFVSSAGMEKSVMLVESQTVQNWGSTYYGSTCSNLVSYALGLPPVSTDNMVWYENDVKKMMPGLTFVHDLIVNGEEQNMNDAQLADILWAPGHCAMITDIIKKDGVVTDIEVTEASMTFLSTARRWMWKLEDFYRWFSVFGLYRYNALDTVKYYPSLFAPMPDEGQRFAYINRHIMPYYGNKCIVSSSDSIIRLIVKNVEKVGSQSGEMAYTHILIRKNGSIFGNPIEIDLTKGTEPYYVDVPIDDDEAIYTALLCAYEDNAISRYTSECKWIVKSAHTPQITFDENNTLKIVVTLRNLGFKPEYYIASITNTIVNRNAIHITQDMLQEEVNGDNVTYTITRSYEDSRTFKRLKVGYTSPEYGTFFELYDM